MQYSIIQYNISPYFITIRDISSTAATVTATAIYYINHRGEVLMVPDIYHELWRRGKSPIIASLPIARVPETVVALLKNVQTTLKRYEAQEEMGGPRSPIGVDVYSPALRRSAGSGTSQGHQGPAGLAVVGDMSSFSGISRNFNELDTIEEGDEIEEEEEDEEEEEMANQADDKDISKREKGGEKGGETARRDISANYDMISAKLPSELLELLNSLGLKLRVKSDIDALTSRDSYILISRLLKTPMSELIELEDKLRDQIQLLRENCK